MKKRVVQSLTSILGILYAVYLQSYVGMTDTKEFAFSVAVFVVVVLAVLAAIVYVLRKPNNRFGNEKLMIIVIMPWFILAVAPLLNYLWPDKNVFFSIICFIVGWGSVLFPLGWAWQQWHLKKQCRAVTTAHVVDNEASVIPEKGRDFDDTTPNLFHPVFAFAVNGKTYRVTSDDGLGEPKPIGEAVTLYYDPMDVTCWLTKPVEINRLARIFIIAFVLGGLCAFATGIFILML